MTPLESAPRLGTVDAAFVAELDALGFFRFTSASEAASAKDEILARRYPLATDVGRQFMADGEELAERGIRSPGGPAGLTIAQVQDPSSPDHSPGQVATIGSAVVTWLDTFDETGDGRSLGTLYVQDPGSQAPYAGLGVFAPAFNPTGHTATPGDVAVGITGQYLESPSLGTAVFNQRTFLPQLLRPAGTYRSTTAVPAPVKLTVADLDEDGAATDGNFASGRKWLGMLVTLDDVSVGGGVSASGRVSYPMELPDGGSAPSGAVIDNELFDLRATDYPLGTHFTSITGIVTWFYAFHVAPRSKGDLVQ